MTGCECFHYTWTHELSLGALQDIEFHYGVLCVIPNSCLSLCMCRVIYTRIQGESSRLRRGVCVFITPEHMNCPWEHCKTSCFTTLFSVYIRTQAGLYAYAELCTHGYKVNRPVCDEGCVYLLHLNTWIVPGSIARHLVSLCCSLCTSELKLIFMHVQSYVRMNTR